MRLFVVEARNSDIRTSLFLLLEASSPEDARLQAEAYYQREKWSPASIYEVQPVARPRGGVRLLYRQRWDALGVGTPEGEQTPAQRDEGQGTSPVPIAGEEVPKVSWSAPVETDLLTETRAPGGEDEHRPPREDV